MSQNESIKRSPGAGHETEVSCSQRAELLPRRWLCGCGLPAVGRGRAEPFWLEQRVPTTAMVAWAGARSLVTLHADEVRWLEKPLCEFTEEEVDPLHPYTQR